MKTLADFKRRLTVGLPVTVEFPGMVINGNTGQTVSPGRTVKRKVAEVTAGGIYWEAEAPKTGRGSFLGWPKASCLTFNGENSVAVADEAGGKPFATYHFDT